MSDELAISSGDLQPLPAAQRDKVAELIRQHGRDLGDIRALRQAGVPGSRSQLRRLLDTDQELADAIAEARGRSPETIRDEIKRRAIEGVDEPVFYQGEIVGHIRRYSDSLLTLMAKAHLPEFQERLEIGGLGGGPISLEDRSSSLTDVLRVLIAVKAAHDPAAAGDGGAAARPALPAAPPALAEPADGVGAADGVPGS